MPAPRKKKQRGFWNKEYSRAAARQGGAGHTRLALSDEPSEDLLKFCRWIERQHGRKLFNITSQVVDCGCGNGRNIIYISQNYQMRGLGYDLSNAAIEEARRAAEGLPLTFKVQALADPIPLPDNSCMLALDMMSSHVLNRAQRENLRTEVLRVLKPGGWFFFRSFLLDEDRHAARLLRDNPAEEPGMYIHPEIGIPEYVWTEEALEEFFSPFFTIHKIERSHRHVHKDGTPWKRRTITAYLEKQ